MPTCSYNLQYAESEIDEIDDKGGASSSEILAAFDSFDWPSQVEAANRIQKCSPTFSVRDLDADRLFWVSAYGDVNNLSFVNDYTYQGEVRKFLGLIRTKGPISAPNRELSLQEARRGIELFVDGHHESLLQLLSGSPPPRPAA